MCLIIDVNTAHKFCKPVHADALPVLRWLQKSDGRIAYGGDRLAREIGRCSAEFRRLFAAFVRQGKTVRPTDADVNKEERAVTADGHCISNDCHIIALARVSGARVLFSHDAHLHEDFKNSHLIANPRGAVYQTADHAALLKHSKGCMGRPK